MADGTSTQPRILALVGSTASGKSELAIELALRHGAEIINCDSLLVYRDLTIGTAKPSPEELASLKHHAVDIIDLDQPFTAGDYVRYVRPIIDRLVAANKPVLIVGGTGFYLKALLCGVWDAPPTQPAIRERLEAEVAHLAPDEASQLLHRKLQALDAPYAEKVKANDRYRVVRALEIIEVTGKPVTELLKDRRLQNPLPYPFRVVGIKRSKMDLDRRIIERTNTMFQKGLVNETKALRAKYDPPPRPFYCVGYNEVLQFLREGLTLPECRERVVISTRQLAKKQMTFFRGFPSPIEWFNLPGERDALARAAAEVLGA